MTKSSKLKKLENLKPPEKGKDLIVSPIKDLGDIQKIKELLAKKPRNLCLFTMGINTGLKVSELLAIKVKDVKHFAPGDELIIENESEEGGQPKRIPLNKAVVETIQNLIKKRKLQDDDPLFKSKRGVALTAHSVRVLVRKWCEKIEGNFGALTLRKTWGYHQRITFGVSLSELMDHFNHSSLKQTRGYLDIEPKKKVKISYMNEL
jgi:integrase